MRLETLAAGAAHLGIDLSTSQLEDFARYLSLMIEANHVINLTSVREPESIIRRHFLESIQAGSRLARLHLLQPGVRLLDLGSGAGLPGLPIKLTWPALDLSLLEATAKKARFLQSVVAKLDLDGARALCDRAESLAREPELRGAFDLVTARAVAPLPVLVELALPFLRLNGHLAALKGSRAADEIIDAEEALRACGGRVVAVEALDEVSSVGLVLVEKVKPTPELYPRRAGLPAARPLGTSV